jgi:hypothetical protein
MGAFIANFHVRFEDSDAVRKTVSAIGLAQFRVASAAKGWVSLYEQRASTQDEDWIVRLASEISSRLRTVCVAFLVHDSDIARYWLSEQGQLLDEYCSIPDYFEAVSAAERRRVRGRADVFLRFCQPSVTCQDIERVLRTDVTFAEDTITRLAGFLGIDPERVLGDFNHPETGGGFGGSRAFADFEEDDEQAMDSADADSLSGPGSIMQRMQQQLAGMFASPRDPGTSPQSNALVEAAATGNVEEIERLVETGTEVNAPGLLPLLPPGGSGLFGGMGFPPKMALSPLMAAASRGQVRAAQRLVELGAQVNEDHPLYGSALHVAAQSGSPEMVQLLLAAGIPAKIKNRQGQTPRNLLQAVRNQIAMARNLVKTMPHFRQVYDQFAPKLEDLPEAGWAACEELLCQAEG